jgi:hypothetical protein
LKTDAAVLEQLAFARRIADHANRLGAHSLLFTPRAASDHLGALLADAVLQAGVNYKTVVRMRITRIESQFPETATLSGVIALIERGGAGDFMLWKHPTKVTRFESLAKFLAMQGIETSVELRGWLCLSSARQHLLSLNGIGPKTYDYLCCLVGIDCIAIDRHVKTFAKEAGVSVSDYHYLKSVVSYAADLLGMRRRDFDAWIWQTISTRTISDGQLYPAISAK